MKKSKIIVPALALIAFSTAASITGTVAWFTASRSATMSLGTYTVASVAKGLSYSLGASGDVGTTVCQLPYRFFSKELPNSYDLQASFNNDITEAEKEYVRDSLESECPNNLEDYEDLYHLLFVYMILGLIFLLKIELCLSFLLKTF